MILSRSLLVVGALCCLVAPARASAQSASFERRPFLVLNGGFGVQGSRESTIGSGLGGPQASVGLGVRLTRSVALRAEYGGQWFLQGAEPATMDCPVTGPCRTSPSTEDLRTAHLLAELRLRDRPAARTVTYIVAGPSLAWAPNDKAVPAGTASGGVERSAPGATLGLGFGLRAAPGSDRALRLEARYTALTHAAAATRSIVGLSLGFWL